MSFGGVTIPQIAITTEPSEWNSSMSNIGETLTDVEDLDEGTSKKVKSKLKIKLADDGATTDLEDLETSDVESDGKVQAVSFDDLHLDACHFEEAAGTVGKLSQSFKVKGQELSVLPPDEGLTDAENFDTDEEPDFGEVPELDINFDDYHSDYVNISSDYKAKPQYLVFPVADINDLTDLESVYSDSETECLVRKTKTKRRKSRGSYKTKGGGSDVEVAAQKSKRCTKIKKSLSHPVNLHHHNTWPGFESDGEAENQRSLKFPLCKRVTKKRQNILTDTEELEEDSNVNFIGVQEKQQILNSKAGSTPIETDIESLEGDFEELEMPQIVLPPPVLTLILLHEDKSLVPTTKIVPLEETHDGGLSVEDTDGGVTDTELFDAEDDLLNIETYHRGPTPDICHYEDSNVVYGESQLAIPKEIAEPLTDTEDLAAGDYQERAKNKTLSVFVSNDLPTTDTEDFYVSDSNKSPLRRQRIIEDTEERSVTPYYIKETDGAIISSKDSDGTSTTKNRLNITEPKRVDTSPDLTDVEDLVASADEDIRAETATPIDFSKHLDQGRSSRVHIESTKKLNLDSANEIMYLKGGSFRQNHTDVEDMSDDNEVMRDWDVSKKSASQEEAPFTQDAEQQGEESSFAATGGPQDSILKVEGEESTSGDQQTDQTSSQQRSVADQHQLSEEMKQLLKELEKESKQ